MVVFNVEEMIY